MQHIYRLFRPSVSTNTPTSGYVEDEPAVPHPDLPSPGAGPTVVGLDDDMDANPLAPFADMGPVDDDEKLFNSPPVTAQKKRGRPSLGSRSASDTPTRTTVAKTPKTGKSTAKTPKSGKSMVASKGSDRKRKAAELEEEGENNVDEPAAKKGGRPVRTTGVAASARLAARAAKKPTRGRPKSTEVRIPSCHFKSHVPDAQDRIPPPPRASVVLPKRSPPPTTVCPRTSGRSRPLWSRASTPTAWSTCTLSSGRDSRRPRTLGSRERTSTMRRR